MTGHSSRGIRAHDQLSSECTPNKNLGYETDPQHAPLAGLPNRRGWAVMTLMKHKIRMHSLNKDRKRILFLKQTLTGLGFLFFFPQYNLWEAGRTGGKLSDN